MITTGELRRRAEAWASEVLPGPRWRVELTDERARRHKSWRPAYRVRFRAWELAGAARVPLGAGGQPGQVTFPTGDLDAPGFEPLPDDAPARALVLEAALVAARRSIPDDALAVRLAVWRRTRGGREVVVAVERARPDGELALDLDPETGERLGLLALPLLRGSRRSAAIGRMTALARARAGAAAARGGALCAGAPRRAADRAPVARALPGGGQTLVVTSCTRSGLLVGWSGFGGRACGRARGAGVGARDRAAAALRLTVELRLGERARLSPPVPGARAGRRVWLAVVHAPDGRLFRAVLDGGRVELVRRDPSALGRSA
ncbi:MAG: hypothetical protein KF878_10555 [Planctomycetes bacterium]|nr:hypothetical protein [Planctomycetota bacterium]